MGVPDEGYATIESCACTELVLALFPLYLNHMKNYSVQCMIYNAESDFRQIKKHSCVYIPSQPYRRCNVEGLFSRAVGRGFDFGQFKPKTIKLASLLLC